MIFIFFFKCPPHPPSPASVKVPFPGETNIETNTFGMIHYDFLPPPSPSLASVKVPFRGKQIWNKIMFQWLFVILGDLFPPPIPIPVPGISQSSLLGRNNIEIFLCCIFLYFFIKTGKVWNDYVLMYKQCFRNAIKHTSKTNGSGEITIKMLTTYPQETTFPQI